MSMSGRSEAAEEIARQVKLQLDVKLAEAARVPVPDSSIGTEALTLMDSPQQNRRTRASVRWRRARKKRA